MMCGLGNESFRRGSSRSTMVNKMLGLTLTTINHCSFTLQLPCVELINILSFDQHPLDSLSITSTNIITIMSYYHPSSFTTTTIHPHTPPCILIHHHHSSPYTTMHSHTPPPPCIFIHHHHHASSYTTTTMHHAQPPLPPRR